MLDAVELAARLWVNDYGKIRKRAISSIKKAGYHIIPLHNCPISSCALSAYCTIACTLAIHPCPAALAFPEALPGILA
jgi:hypothetical protein